MERSRLLLPAPPPDARRVSTRSRCGCSWTTPRSKHRESARGRETPNTWRKRSSLAGNRPPAGSLQRSWFNPVGQAWTTFSRVPRISSKHLLPGKTAQHGFGLIEQGAHQINGGVAGRWTGPFHPRHTFSPRAAQQPKKKQLHLIVGVMGESNCFNFQPSRCASQKVMAQLAGRHFNGKFFPPRKCSHISSSGDEPEAQLYDRGLDELLISVAVSPAQAMIEVNGHQSPFVLGSQLAKHVQQGHRVQSAGDANQNWLAAAKKSPGLDCFADSLQKITHINIFFVRFASLFCSRL